MAAVDAVVDFVSGEKWLDWLKRPNGGTIILIRSLWVTAILYLLVLPLRSWAQAEWSTRFDWGQLGKDIAETIPWFGAIFAAVYVALYARFASQWSYLAGVYNQIRQTHVTWNCLTENNADHMNLWKAGFIEDAIDLHLATKPMFATYISRLLEIPGVCSCFDDIADNGPERRAQLQRRLRDMGIERGGGVDGNQRSI